MQMIRGGLMTKVPIWVRVSATIALVLVGVLISTMILGGAGASGGHDSGGRPTMTDHGGLQGGAHGSPRGTKLGDHSRRQAGGHGSGANQK